MSEAVEGAELMLYGVSEAYKESGNCRVSAVPACVLACLLAVGPVRLSALSTNDDIAAGGQLRLPTTGRNDSLVSRERLPA